MLVVYLSLETHIDTAVCKATWGRKAGLWGRVLMSRTAVPKLPEWLIVGMQNKWGFDSDLESLASKNFRAMIIG